MRVFLRDGRALLVGLTVVLLLACQDSTPTSPELSRAPYNGPAPAAPVWLGAPVFGLDVAPDGSLLAAVASAGLVGIRTGATELIDGLPGLSDVASLGRGDAYVITGGSDDPALLLPTSQKLFRLSNGSTREIADLWAFEQAVNPDAFWRPEPNKESNPFKIALLDGGHLLVADAAANDVLLVEPGGKIDWIAVLTPVSPSGPEPVSTSVAVGPDGAIYIGELTGFPGTPGLSRIWRVAPGSRHVVCPSSACVQFAGGFTSIMDITFGPDGRLYVVELDEQGWFALELNGFFPTSDGGTVSACYVNTAVCSPIATGLSLPTTVTDDRNGTVWVADHLPMLVAAARASPVRSAESAVPEPRTGRGE
jgi:hypothetical protein